MLRGRALALLALGVLAAPLPARAAFHFSVISELLTSYDGDADVQAVEIEMLSSGQTLTENSVLAVFDASGDYVADALVVPSDLANGGAGRHWLMGTAAFETASGLQVDFEFAPVLPVAGGMVCWGAPGKVPPPDPESWDRWSRPSRARLGCIGVELTAGLGLDCDELDGDALHGACFQ